jgi:hypothetical protein
VVAERLVVGRHVRFSPDGALLTGIQRRRNLPEAAPIGRLCACAAGSSALSLRGLGDRFGHLPGDLVVGGVHREVSEGDDPHQVIVATEDDQPA